MLHHLNFDETKATSLMRRLCSRNRLARYIKFSEEVKSVCKLVRYLRYEFQTNVIESHYSTAQRSQSVMAFFLSYSKT